MNHGSGSSLLHYVLPLGTRSVLLPLPVSPQVRCQDLGQPPQRGAVALGAVSFAPGITDVKRFDGDYLLANETTVSDVLNSLDWEGKDETVYRSLGQYQNCRIPVSAPIPPACFIDFIPRNFYNTAFIKYADGLPKSPWCFDDSILALEQSVVHIKIPTIQQG